MRTFFERLDNFMKYKGLNDNRLTIETGISNGLIGKGRKRGSISQENISTILNTYPELSADWLLTGKGSMLHEVCGTAKEETNAACETIESYKTKTSEKKILSGEKRIPLVYQSAVAGFGNFDFSVSAEDVKEFYVVPKFKYCRVDFMIEISGTSMYPQYNSGDVVACTILKQQNFIQWNKCHIIATRDQGILCKRICPSEKENCIKAVSDNPDYPPFDIPTTEITGIALVCGVIRLE